VTNLRDESTLSHTHQRRTNVGGGGGGKMMAGDREEKAMVAKGPLFNFFLVEDILENLNYKGRRDEVHFTIF